MRYTDTKLKGKIFLKRTAIGVIIKYNSLKSINVLLLLYTCFYADCQIYQPSLSLQEKCEKPFICNWESKKKITLIKFGRNCF